MALGIIEYLTIGNSMILGWITLDILANLLLVKHKRGTYIRFFGSLYTKRTNAIIASFAQFILAVGFSFFINELWAWVISFAVAYLLPISIATGVILYLYILLGLPYKVKTWKRLGPAVGVLAIAGLLVYIIHILK